MDIKDDGNLIFANNSKTILPSKNIKIYQKKLNIIKKKYYYFYR